MKSCLFVKLFVYLGCLTMSSSYADVPEVFWEELMPPNYQAPVVAFDHNNAMAQQNLDAPLVTTFNDKIIKVPGFVVPLEGDGTLTTEFLLVPFFGACIHVPPPPPNQIVYVKFPEGVPITSLSDAVWVEGKFSTQGWSGDIATVGYSMQAIEITPFEG